ncbi:MAG TPA: hypothetical protein VFZ76_10120 [Anaerolineales bacterium]
MATDPYEGMAERYDLSFGLFGEQDPQMSEFFRQLFTNHGVHDVLDCARGTGRHLPLFQGLGCEVWASLGEFIASMTMLAYSPSEKDIVAVVGNLSIFDYIQVWKDLTDISRR